MNAVVHQVIDSTKQQNGIALEYSICSLMMIKLFQSNLIHLTFFDYGGQVLVHFAIPLKKISAMM